MCLLSKNATEFIILLGGGVCVCVLLIPYLLCKHIKKANMVISDRKLGQRQSFNEIYVCYEIYLKYS